MPVDIQPALDFLKCPTPRGWIDEAIKPDNLEILLIDHANNELKAAGNALSIMRRYGHYAPNTKACKDKKESEPDPFMEKKAAPTALDPMFRSIHSQELLNKMSRLAREELRHFEQVLAIMEQRNIRYRQVSASRYPGVMREAVRKKEPGQLVDILITGAFIEARSCERFHKLTGHVDAGLGKFYRSLLRSEGRHFQDYLSLAKAISHEDIASRVAHFAEIDRQAVESPDARFRFHSGIPVS